METGVVTEKSLLERVDEHLRSRDAHLPVIDEIGMEVRRVVASGDFDLREVESLINKDQALAAAVLRGANSAFYRGIQKVLTVGEAVARIGARQVANLVLLETQRKNFVSDSRQLRELFRALWRHSVACAAGAEWLARRLHFQEMADHAFVAGLLHDLGKLLLLRVIDELQAEDFGQAALTEHLTRELLQSFHADRGAALMEAWELPEIYTRVAREHHAESFDPDDVLLVVVRLVDRACGRLGIGMTHEPSLDLAATPEARCLEASELLLAELEVLLEDSLELAA
jgi:putative nucleotidyltransferase with HDIG domain